MSDTTETETISMSDDGTLFADVSSLVEDTGPKGSTKSKSSGSKGKKKTAGVKRKKSASGLKSGSKSGKSKTESASKKAKRRRDRGFRAYLYKAVKQAQFKGAKKQPLSINASGLDELNDVTKQILKDIFAKANEMRAISKKSTLSVQHIDSAIKLFFMKSGQLKPLLDHAYKVVQAYDSGKLTSKSKK